MREKNLPIKIFEKRGDIDERLTEGGGNDELPKWVLSGWELKNKSDLLLNELSTAQKRIQQKFNKYSSVPTLIKAKIIDNALAKTHRADLTQFFQLKKQNRTIGFTENQELLIRIDNPSELLEISTNLYHYDKNPKVISGVKNIEAFEPNISLDNITPQKDGKYIIKVKLLNYDNYQINTHVLQVFQKLLTDNIKIKLDRTVRYTNNNTIFQISIDSIEALFEIDDFNGIMSIEPMPIYDITEDSLFVEEMVHIPAPKKDTEYPVIGVLDSGIANIPQLNSWIVGRHTSYPQNLIDPSHGTFVAGIASFGDILEGKKLTFAEGCRLFDATVYPNPKLESVTEAELVDNIREVIEKYCHTIKIWNMSLGSKVEIKNSEFSDFGAALDSIQDENDVLIIKSAGNCNNFLNSMPVSKIARGADSIRALTVGSIAHSQLKNDLSPYNHLSPFSRIGPGPANIIKPDLVHYGGNCGVDNGKLIINGVHSLNKDGTLRKDIGTSFSTPRVAAIVADIHHKLREEFDPVLLKALTIHSAKYPYEVDLDMNEKINQFGFGLPSSADEILYNNPHEITLILRDNLNKGEFIEILDFPYPESLIDQNGYYYGQVFLTLVNTPILSEGQGPEYCQSNIDIYFGTYDQKKTRDTSKRTVKNPIGREGQHNLLLSSNYSKKRPLEFQHQFSKTEQILVQYSGKFYPIKKYAVDISKLTPTKKEKHAQSSKKWFLKLEGLYRDYIEKQGEEKRMDLSQEFCIIITIRDPFKQKFVYQEVSQLLQSNNFLHRNIKLRQDIDINLDGG
ncbi:S8 family peptidase [Paenibacillus oleatilyticus]|uniref:S8 family peptidase n=1 Tax=Paenibacillus oleatilyticus TaxID=2594886 RepID=A0ABV4V1H0_9BACL